MRRIMFFRPMLYMGGTEIAILNLIKNLNKSNYDIYIGYSDNESDKNLLEEYGKYATVMNVKENDIKVDVLINCSPYISAIKEFSRVEYEKIYLWFHHFGKSGISIFEDVEHIKKLDKIVVVSEATKKIMLENSYGELIKDKIDVIYNVLNVNEIIEKSKEIEEIQLSKGLNIVTICRLSLDKGFYRNLALAECFKRRGLDFKWYIVGSSYYPEIEFEIKNMFKEYEDHFVFVGPKQNPFGILKQCDYLTLLSDDETWGLVITEAKILGIPCIVTDFNVAYEQIEDMKNGIILSRTELNVYDERIEEIIKNKESFKEALKDFSYNIETIVNSWEKIL